MYIFEAVLKNDISAQIRTLFACTNAHTAKISLSRALKPSVNGPLSVLFLGARTVRSVQISDSELNGGPAHSRF